MSQNVPRKLKILALHGYMQSAEKFREKTYPFQRKVKKYAEFVFIDAPYKVQNEFVDKDKPKVKDNGENSSNNCENQGINITSSGEASLGHNEASVELIAEENFKSDKNIQHSEDTDFYAWYLRHPNETDTGYIYTGLKETFDYLDSVFNDKGPFDGIFGFSQGGCVVGLLCDLQQRNLTQHVKFDFAIMASAFKHETEDFYRETIDIASLHIFGENDRQIPSQWSQNLQECFQNPVIAKHSGGHYIPGNSTLKKEYEMFFKEQWFRKFGDD